MIIRLNMFDNEYIIRKLKERDVPKTIDKASKLPERKILISQIEKFKKDNLFYNTTTGMLKCKKHGILSQYSNKNDIIDYTDYSIEEIFTEQILNDLYCLLINPAWYL